MEWFATIGRQKFAQRSPTLAQPRPPRESDAAPKRVYEEMLCDLQRGMLQLLILLSIPLSIYFGFTVFRDAFVTLRFPREVFYVHCVGFLLSITWACAFYSRNVFTAWIGIILISILSNYVQIQLTQTLGIVFFILFATIGPLISFRSNHVLVLSLSLAVAVQASNAIVVHNEGSRTGVISLFYSLVLGFVCVGIVVRRFVRNAAQAKIRYSEIASTRARDVQHAGDLKQHFEKISSLEHDMRQPLRTTQGCLNALASDLPQAEVNELVVPALAASQRAERLLNNLLDESRDAVANNYAYFQIVNIVQLLADLEPQIVGLARYYTESLRSVSLNIIQPLPFVRLDQEQFSRALLNLLDNALTHASCASTVRICVWASGVECCVSVSDDGPGLPTSTLDALADKSVLTPGLRLGLRQVKRMVLLHHGRLTVCSDESGTSIVLHIPVG